MGTFKHTTSITRPTKEVIAWHKRPGALTRATPHWAGAIDSDQGVSEGLQAKLKVAVPGTKGLITKSWTALLAQVTDTSFTDIALNAPVATWKHRHDFLETANQTVIRDTIDYALTQAHAQATNSKNSKAVKNAEALLGGVESITSKFSERTLEKIFEARAHRITADLNFQERYADIEPQTIVIAGASGMIGRQVSALLTTGGHKVRTLVRRSPASAHEYYWNPDQGTIDQAVFDGVDAVIHLGGTSINTRFNDKNKKQILDSRIKSTGLLARTLAELAGEGKGPQTLVVASAIGYYGANRHGEVLNEDASAGRDFLANVCTQWEQATQSAQEAGVRVVNVRTGIVLTPLGGALRLQLPLFLAGTGGTVGAGRNMQSWISLDDIAGIYVHATFRKEVQGALNAVASTPVENRELASAIGRTLKRPAFVHAPRLASDALLGREGTEQLVLADQQVSNAKLLGTGYVFFDDDLLGALKNELG